MNRKVVFHKEEGNYGSVSTLYGGTIVINLAIHARKLPERTFFHECLHCLFPLESERGIRAIEEREWRKFTAKQRFLLAKKLYNRKWRA